MTMDNKKFYELSPQERLDWLARETGLPKESLDSLSGQAGLTSEGADHMIENVVGTFALPIGVAQNFLVNGREVLVPMAIEEPSVVAAASYMAKLARAGGGFTASSDEPHMIGQMQILDLKDISQARQALEAHKQELLEAASGIDPLLQKLGGGPRDVIVREMNESAIGPFLVLHLVMDVRDAMGANAINTALERLTPLVERISGGRVLLRILSNPADRPGTRILCHPGSRVGV